MKNLVFALTLFVGLIPSTYAFEVLADTPAPKTSAAHLEQELETYVRKMIDDLLNETRIIEKYSGQKQSKEHETAYNNIKLLLKTHFDMNHIARNLVGEHWRRFDENQLKEYKRLLSDSIVNIYTNRVIRYNVVSYDIKRVRNYKKKLHSVHSEFINEKEEKHRLDFMIKQNGTTKHVVNVSLDGVSELNAKRSEYTSFLSNRSVSDFLKELENLRSRSARGATE